MCAGHGFPLKEKNREEEEKQNVPDPFDEFCLEKVVQRELWVLKVAAESALIIDPFETTVTERRRHRSLWRNVMRVLPQTT